MTNSHVCPVCKTKKELTNENWYFLTRGNKTKRASRCRKCTTIYALRMYYKKRDGLTIPKDKENKRCPGCKETKPRTKDYWHIMKPTPFYKTPQLGSYCRKCVVVRTAKWREENPTMRKASDLRKTFGISYDEYMVMWKEQGGVCFVCKQPQVKRRKYLDVDHDHSTGAIRGLLCEPHNQAIGMFKDNPAWLRAAADYIENPPIKGKTIPGNLIQFPVAAQS